MVKAISGISNFGKRSAMAAIFAGAMTLSAGAITLNNTNSNSSTSTELVSKAGAEALKANALSPQTTQYVSTVHNYKLDNTYRKFIESEEDRNYIENTIKTVYQDKGTFLGSVLVQCEIDAQALSTFMAGNVKLMKNKLNPELGRTIESLGPKFTKTLIPNKTKVENWLLNTYAPYMGKALSFDHKPTGEEVCKRLDTLVPQMGFTLDELIEYDADSYNFLHDKLHNVKNTQNMSNLVAYKTHIINRLLMLRAMKNSSVFTEDAFVNSEKGLYEYYLDWMKTVEPKGM